MRGKRTIHRTVPGGDLLRSADGRLRPASDGPEPNEVWAEQKRLQLKQAIVRDQKKAARRQQFRSFFGAEQPSASRRTAKGAHTVEIKIQIPHVSWPGLTGYIRRLCARVPIARWRTRSKVLLGGLIILAGVITGVSIYDNDLRSQGKEAHGVQSVLGVGREGSPDYRTLLPVDKTIEDLGGWGRVSPPDKEPVYAYQDSIAGTRITVSQQPLPAQFQKSTESELAELAESFSATEQIVIGDIRAYMGTSAKGPQSVIFAKDGLLLLLRSDARIKQELWMAYIGSLR